MLIEKKEMQKGDVISMKLTSGDEVIARFVSMTADVVQVKKPVCLVPSPQGLAMVPFMFSLSEDAELNIERNVVMTHTKARKEVADAYTQQTSSIMTASQAPPAANMQNNNGRK